MLVYLLLSIFSGTFSLSHLDFEMSCDTYEYGVDASPMVRTKNGDRPKIDSIDTHYVYGMLNGKELRWDSAGVCLCLDETKDLEFTDLFYKGN